MMSRLLQSITALLVLLSCAVAARGTGGWETVEEHWYAIEIDNAPAGWSRTIVAANGDTLRTETQTNLRIRRGDATLELVTEDSFVERADGTPVRMRRLESSSGTAIEHEWEFNSDHVRQVTRQGDRTTQREYSLPEGVWLTPRAATRFLDERRAAGAQEIAYRTITPDAGLTPIMVTTTHERDDQYELGGRTIPVSVWRSEFDAMPIVVREFISKDGVVVKQEIELGRSRMVLRRREHEEIRQQIATGRNGEPPDLLLANLIRPDRPIKRVHQARRAVLRVLGADGERPSLAEAGAQRIAPDENDERALIVTVDVDNPTPASLDENRDQYLASSTLIDHEDDAVRALAADNGREQDDPFALARELQRRVNRHVTGKTLDVAFASASETVRSQRGDCTEHAVLLAALFRAHGIPARIATGLVYANHFAGEDHIFGWHMWTQAWIDGVWWDFDAVLSDQRFHAGYVLVSTSALGDERRFAGLDEYFKLLGNVEIEVVDVMYE